MSTRSWREAQTPSLQAGGQRVWVALNLLALRMGWGTESSLNYLLGTVWKRVRARWQLQSSVEGGPV